MREARRSPRTPALAGGIYGKNLGDEEYAQYIITLQGLIGQIAVFAPPKTYGVQFGYNF